jgi:hypothetical protein
MADFPFVGDAYTANSIYQDDQELINWFVEDDPRKQAKSAIGPADRGDLTLYPTPGYILRTQLNVGEVRGLYTRPGGQTMIAVSGSSVYSVNTAWVQTKIGTLTTSSGPVKITDNGIDVYITDGQNRYYYVVSSGVFATLPPTDGGFTGADVCDIIDNFIVYNRPGSQQWGSTDALSPISQSLSFASKFGSSDKLVTLICNNREVRLLGERTSEAWVDVGAFPFPFQIIPGTSNQYGCAAKFSVAQLGASFAFMSVDARGKNVAVQMDGYQPVRISTSAVENDLDGDVIDDAIGFTYQVRGHEFYVLNFPTADKTWVYDASTNFWHKWLSFDPNTGYHRHRSNCFTFFQGQAVIGDFENGKLYTLDVDAYTDDGQPIRRVRRCPHIVNDFRRVYHKSLQLQFQPGVGLDGTQQGANPQAMLRWSNDGGSTWSAEHWVAVGKSGQYKNRAIWRRLGEARDRVYEVAVTDPVKWVLVSANLEAVAGAN